MASKRLAALPPGSQLQNLAIILQIESWTSLLQSGKQVMKCRDGSEPASSEPGMAAQCTRPAAARAPGSMLAGMFRLPSRSCVQPAVPLKQGWLYDCAASVL